MGRSAQFGWIFYLGGMKFGWMSSGPNDPLELETVTDVEMMPAPTCIVKNMTCSEFPLKSKCRGIGIGNFIYILTLWPLVLGRLISLLTLIEFGLVS